MERQVGLQKGVTSSAKKRYRWGRIALALALPAPLGILLSVLFVAPEQTDFTYWSTALLVAYLIAFLPSLLFALVMEFLVNPKISSHYLVVLISILLNMLPWVPLFKGGVIGGITGLIVGLLMGILLRWWYQKSPEDRRQRNLSKTSDWSGNKRKWLRIILAIVLPVPLGVLCILVITHDLARVIEDNGSTFFFLLLFGYLFTGLQSILYALLMEYLINPKVQNHYLVVLSSMVLGTLSGIPVFIIGVIPGAVVGLLMGILLRVLYLQAPAPLSLPA